MWPPADFPRTRLSGSNVAAARATPWGVIAWLIVAAPILVFPEVLWRRWPAVPIAVAVISFAVATWASRDSDWMSGLVSAFGIAAIVGWWFARAQPGTPSHFPNLAFGMLLMCVAPLWADTERRLLHLTMLLVALVSVALGLGLIGSDLGVLKLLPVSATGFVPRVSLQIPGLAGEGVNRNVVGILSVLLMPIALSIAGASRTFAGRPVRVAAWVLFVAAALVALLSQSLSVWIAAWAVLVLAPLCVVRRPSWRVSAAALALAGAPLALAAGLFTATNPTGLGRFSQRTGWTPYDTAVLPANIAAPDGTLTGIRLVETSSTGQHMLVGLVHYEPGTYALTLYAKPAGRSSLVLSETHSHARFDLRAGRVSDEAGLPIAGIEAAPGGWLKCSFVFTSTHGGERIGVTMTDDQGEVRYPGTEGAGLHLWNPSMERVTLLGSSALGTVRALALGSANRSIENRRDIWGAGLGALRESPWFGIGFNAFRHEIAVVQGRPRWPHAHNILLQTMLDTGLFGALVYVVLLCTLLWGAYRVSRGTGSVRRLVAPGAALALIGIHVFGIVDAIALGAKVGMFQWFAAGLVVSAMRLEREVIAQPATEAVTA